MNLHGLILYARSNEQQANIIRFGIELNLPLAWFRILISPVVVVMIGRICKHMPKTHTAAAQYSIQLY